MKTHRRTLIETATADSNLPSEFASFLIEHAPWLDGTQEVSDEIAQELLAEPITAFKLPPRKVAEFIERYNTLFQSMHHPEELRQNEAYVAIGQLLAPYGRADAFGEGDYWLISDSFSTKTPVILLYNDFRIPGTALSRLQTLLNSYGTIFSELRVNTDYGAEVVTLRPQ
jgi:hypothetical protein